MADATSVEKKAEKVAKRFRVVVRRRRLELGWTQEIAAERVGMATEAYARLERGTSVPSFATLVMIVDQMGLDPAEVLTLVGEFVPSDPKRDSLVQGIATRVEQLSLEEVRVIHELVSCMVRRAQGVAINV